MKLSPNREMPMFSAALLATCLLPVDEPKSKDFKPLEGLWEITSSVDHGRKSAGKVKMAYAFAGNQYTLSINGADTLTAEFVLDEAAAPKRIVRKLPVVNGKPLGKDVLGIYELKGDTLRIAFATAVKGAGDAAVFPADFDDKKYHVLELKRGKAADRGAEAAAKKAEMERQAEKYLENKAAATPLEGTWTVTKNSMPGREKIDPTKHRMAIAFKGDRYVVWMDGSIQDHGTFHVDASATPPRIDRQADFSTGESGRAKGKLDGGIYELKGDVLKTAFDKPGTDRPTGFDGEKYEVNEFIRDKK